LKTDPGGDGNYKRLLLVRRISTGVKKMNLFERTERPLMRCSMAAFEFRGRGKVLCWELLANIAIKKGKKGQPSGFWANNKN